MPCKSGGSVPEERAVIPWPADLARLSASINPNKCEDSFGSFAVAGAARSVFSVNSGATGRRPTFGSVKASVLVTPAVGELVDNNSVTALAARIRTRVERPKIV